MNSINVTIIAIILLAISTIAGSGLVFFIKKNLTDKASNIIIGLASGIMMSVSFFGLLIPAIEESELQYGNLAVLPVVGGFLLGGVVLFILDKIIPHFHATSKEEEGLENNSLSKNLKLFLAVTMHNIPEGIAVGLACGLALTHTSDSSYMWAALSLAIGIAIQNFPEGAAISISMVDDGVSKKKAFGFGALSGVVEPISAIITIFVASSLSSLLPYLLSFSAGAMIYLTIEELLPEARKGNHVHHGLWAFMIGFALMMILELVL